MHHIMRNPRGIKLIHCTTHLIDLNKYLAVLPGENISDKTCVTEINENLLNSMPYIWNKQEYLQGFDCDHITLKSAINMFERMKTSEYIYEGVVKPSYKKPTRADANRHGQSREMRGEDSLSNTYPEMSESAG